MTIALVFKLVTWILRHRGLAITVCKAGLRIMSDDNLQQDENASQTGEEMSTADAVSLFTTSLNSALAKQKQDILSELQPNRQSSTFTCKESSINSSCQHNKFEFKQEGTKIQFNFNSERIDSLESISSLISQCKFDDTRALINSELDTLRQRNKILKIADRHGWDTVNEYLDDPLADNNEDASKLRGVIVRAGRKRKRPGFQNSSGFNPKNFFRGFGQASTVKNQFNTPNSSNLACFYCKRLGHFARECPFKLYVQRPNPSQQLQQPCHQHNLNLEDSEQVEYNLVYNSYEYVQNVESIKGRLKNRINFWKTKLKPTELVLHTIEFGYVIPFFQEPVSALLKNNWSAIDNFDFVVKAISELLINGCIIEKTFLTW